MNQTNHLQKIPNAALAYPAIVSLMLYIFCYQFAYPFTSTLFLYIAFGCFVMWLILGGRMRLSEQALLMALVTVVSVAGVFYTDNPERGRREAILTAVIFVLLLAMGQSEALCDKMKKAVRFCSFLVLIGVLLQYLFPDTINSVLGVLLREERYEQLMWSYSVDGAYAGFTAQTPETAYFCATLFGFTAFGWLQNKGQPLKKKFFSFLILAASGFAVILTSKRGIAVAMLVAFLVTYLVWGRFSSKTVTRVLGLLLLFVIVLLILNAQNETVHHFLQRFDSLDGDVTTGRMEIWSTALENDPNVLVGKGTGAAYTIFDAGLHNIYLQLYYDHGLIGALVYLAFFIVNLVYALKKREPMAIYIQVLVLVYGMSGNPIYDTSFFIVYTMFSVVGVTERAQTVVCEAGTMEEKYESGNLNIS